MVTPMKRVPGFVAVISVALTVWLMFHPGLAGAQKADVELKGKTMSANFSNVSLEAVLEGIRKDHGIWYKTDVPLSGEKISLQFDSLPVEKGFKRILAGMNHVLVYDAKKGDVVGVVIFGKKKPSASGPAKIVTPLPPGPSTEAPVPSARGRAREGYALPGPVEGTEEEVQVFESVEEAPSDADLREESVEGEEKPEREEKATAEREAEEKEEGSKQDREAGQSKEGEKSE
jgi:hypothetical protein